MAVAKQFGIENYAKLDPLTVGMPHPDAYAAMMSGRTEITSHLASPPFSYQELKNPAVHRVLNTAEAVGKLSILMVMTPTLLRRREPRPDAGIRRSPGRSQRLHHRRPRSRRRRHTPASPT